MALAFKDDLRGPLAASISGVRAHRAFLLCAGALLLAFMAYIAASCGFDAVAKCEVNTYSALGQSRTVMSQIASSSACGF